MALIDPKHWPPEILTEAVHAPWPSRSEVDEMMLNSDPWPHLVHHHNGRTVYVAPNRIFVRSAEDGPSDCRWIVPGTAESRR